MEQKLTTHKNRAPAFSPAVWDPSAIMPSFLSPVSFDPFWWNNDIFADTHRNMTQIFGGLFDNLPLRGDQAPADITEDQKFIRLKIDIPGLEADDIDISTEGGMLTISADKEENKNGAQSHYSFSHSVSLPEGADIDRANVSFVNHRLSIEIPKTNGTAQGGVPKKAAAGVPKRAAAGVAKKAAANVSRQKNKKSRHRHATK